MSIQVQNELNELRERVEVLERLIADLQPKKDDAKSNTLHLKEKPRG